MEEFVKKDFAKILKANALEARRWMNLSDSNVARIYDRNLDALPVTVELYGKYAKIVNYSDVEDEKVKEETIDIVSRMVYVERDKIIYQDRKKREQKEQHEKLDEEAVIVKVKENGLEFICDLTTHIDTGLFLDHVNTRLLVKENAVALKVLNLFSYTGSFSVYAAAGGADSVTSVDLSNTYCEIARENLKNNGFLSTQNYPVISQDATVFVNQAIEKNEKWDLIIFDPPSFSNSHKMAQPFDVKKDANIWFYKLSKILKQKGILIFSTNLATFSLDKSKLKSAYKITEITDDVRPIGFSSKKSGKSRVYLFEKMQDASESIISNSSIRKRKVEKVKDEDFERLVLSMDKEEEDKKFYDKNDKKPLKDRERFNFRDEKSKGDRPRRYQDDRKSFNKDRDRRGNEDRRSFNRDNDRKNFKRGDERRSYRDFDDRPSFRDDRSKFSREDRPSRPRFEDKPRYEDRYSRPRFDDKERFDDRRRDNKRDERPSFNRDDRKFNSDRRVNKNDRRGVRPYGYDSIRESRGRKEENDFFWRDDE